MTSSEREPLLADVACIGVAVAVESKKKLGPLEISKSTKCAILVGIWIANFLGVCVSYLYNPNAPK